MTGPVDQAVVIGGSAGAVQALLQVLPALPTNYGLPILIVVHVPPDRENALVPLLQGKCRIAVKEAEDKEMLRPGVAYFAPSDYHLLVEADASVSLSADEQVNHSRPAIDVLFESAADAFGAGLTAVVLTGANDDGARGLRAVGARGGAALVERVETAYAPAMPAAALHACPTAEELDLGGVVSRLLQLGSR